VSGDNLKASYHILPPPLSASPAKYWTSLSLWLHSYSVGRTFQLLINQYEKYREDLSAPELDEAFLIGFLHDLGQKLNIRGKASDLKLLEMWIYERLEELGHEADEIKRLTRYILTNPAESRTDPTYPKEVWSLLWLADRIQGLSNPLQMYELLISVGEQLGLNLHVKVLNIAIPQPFLRSYLSMQVYKKLEETSKNSENFVLSLSTPYGIALLTDNPNLEVMLDWREDIAGYFEREGFFPEAVEEDIVKCLECCKDKACLNKYGKRGGKSEASGLSWIKRFTKRDCKSNTYEILLGYYGFKHSVEIDIKLPKYFKEALQGIKLNGKITFIDGNVICPICGYTTPVGLPPSVIYTFYNMTMEQWARKYLPGNLNIFVQKNKPYAIDPICFADLSLRGRLNWDIIISFTNKAPLPIEVVHEVASVLWKLNELSDGKYSSELLYSNSNKDDSNKDEFKKTLEELSKAVEGSIGKGPLLFDIFSVSVYLGYNRKGKNKTHQEEWIKDMKIAGTLSAWGIYPLSILPSPPSIANDALLTYYKGTRPLYDFAPSNKDIGVYTPYVAATLMSIEVLNQRKERGENLPAVLEVLDYPPQLSPILLNYSSPDLYSVVENLYSRLRG